MRNVIGISSVNGGKVAYMQEEAKDQSWGGGTGAGTSTG
jgi:hypothetical protein